MAAIWNAGVEVGMPTVIGRRRHSPRSSSRRRNGMRPSASPCSSTARESPSIWTMRRRRLPVAGGGPSRTRRISRSTRCCRPRTTSSRGIAIHCTIALAMASATSMMVAAVRAFVDTEVRPVAAEVEHADAYPHGLVARMRDLGLFGALLPAEYGGLGLDVTTYARVIEELCRGFMSLAGVINSHTMAALTVLHHGTDAQRRRFLPRFAAGQARGGLGLTEPHAGSDVQAIRTTARREGDRYVVDGSKMFITNGREGRALALLALTDPRAQPRHRGMSCFIVEKSDHPGFRVGKSLAKLGYKGVDTVELLFEACEVPVANL